MRRFFVLLAASVFLCSLSYAQNQAAPDQASGAQDPPPPVPTLSLGEIARQVKLKKQQREAQLKAKEAPSQDAQASAATPAPPAKTAHLVTNDDAPERATVTSVSTHPASVPADSQADTGDHQAKAEKWKSQILAQKNAVAQLQQEMKSLGDSIHFAGGNCIANCAQWNERQQQKQQEVDSMKAQLEEQQKALEEMQEAARKEGFGSTVYDP
ncbi:MAG TPA: hypothetical protein VJP02_28090 [Candidatus Sulfotelmatobacter sp.]|nr:hypothetical protein [Candidatus Sulfotelmatobacter sp.]